VVTKEMIPAHGPVVEKPLIQLRIADQDLKGLVKKLGRKSSYQDSRALLTHYNVIFNLYKNGSLHGNITLSTITGNIEIQTEKQAFYGNISKELGQYLLDVFHTYEVIERIGTSNLEGLRKQNKY
jgi:hypothetical protein